MPTNTITSRTFTYKVPNERYTQSDSNNDTVSLTYNGPDKVFLFVDADGENKGKRSLALQELLEADDGATVPLPLGTVRVEVTLADDPLIMAIVRPGGSTNTVNNDSEVTETVGAYTVKYQLKPDVGITYVHEDKIVYDIDNETWAVPAYRGPDVTWTDVIENRDAMLEGSDGKISPDMPSALKTPWVNYRAALRALPTVFKHGESDEIEAWKVQYPLAPDTKAG